MPVPSRVVGKGKELLGISKGEMDGKGNMKKMHTKNRILYRELLRLGEECARM